MRVFLDTNILVSGFVAHGACAQLVEECLDSHRVVLSEQVLREFSSVLLNKFRSPAEKVNAAIQLLCAACEIMNDPSESPSVCRDAADNAILAAAKATRVDCLITGDADLLVLHPHEGMPILNPAGFWRFVLTQAPG